jgi:hypothetical protein
MNCGERVVVSKCGRRLGKNRINVFRPTVKEDKLTDQEMVS